VLRVLHDDRGNAIHLGPELGKGGEGAVYEVQACNDMVAKLYHVPAPPDKAQKILSMVRVAGRDLLGTCCWPTTPLFSETRSLVGFLMPSAKGYKPIHRTYSPAQRRLELAFFRNADWAWLVRTARNLAVAFHTIHSHGHIVGDVNQGNAMVSAHAVVRLIDCDSFQIRHNGTLHYCEVGVPHFTPPELQGKTFRGIERTANHDSFGLALLCFHLLFGGRHPFAGRYQGKGDITIETAISQHLFAFSQRPPRHELLPPPSSLQMQHLPNYVAELFERAFAARCGPRPTPAEWIRALDALSSELRDCPAVRGHKYAASAGRCPWCDILHDGGPELFISVQLMGCSRVAFDADAVWNAILSMSAPQCTELALSPPPTDPFLSAMVPALPERPDLSGLFASTPGTADAPSIEVRRALMAESVGLLGAGGMLFLAILSLLWQLPWMAFLAFAGTLSLLAMGVIATVECGRERRKRRGPLADAEGLAAHWRSTMRTDSSSLLQKYALLSRRHGHLVKAAKMLHLAIAEKTEWLIAAQGKIGSRFSEEMLQHSERFCALRSDANKVWEAYRTLQQREREELDRLDRNVEQTQRQQFLRRFMIEDALIPGFGRGLKAQLASFGIETAADLTHYQLRKLGECRGFGEKRISSLQEWRESVILQFQFDPARQSDPVASAQIQARYGVRRHEITTQLTRIRKELEDLSRAARDTEAEARALLVGIQEKTPESIVARHRDAIAQFRDMQHGFSVELDAWRATLADHLRLATQYRDFRQRYDHLAASCAAVKPLVVQKICALTLPRGTRCRGRT